jgi:hypothetical protein
MLGADSEEENMDDLTKRKLDKLIEIEGYASIEELMEAFFPTRLSLRPHFRLESDAATQRIGQKESERRTHCEAMLGHCS